MAARPDEHVGSLARRVLTRIWTPRALSGRWSPTERALWRLETERWVRGNQDPQLIEFGDRYFEDEAGRTFMHLPDRREILEDLAATGWTHVFDAMRREIARETRAVRDFSDECRFWVAHRA